MAISTSEPSCSHPFMKESKIKDIRTSSLLLKYLFNVSNVEFIL